MIGRNNKFHKRMLLLGPSRLLQSTCLFRLDIINMTIPKSELPGGYIKGEYKWTRNDFQPRHRAIATDLESQTTFETKELLQKIIAQLNPESFTWPELMSTLNSVPGGPAIRADDETQLSFYGHDVLDDLLKHGLIERVEGGREVYRLTENAYLVCTAGDDEQIEGDDSDL